MSRNSVLLSLFQWSNEDDIFVIHPLQLRDNKNLSQQVIGETKKAPLSRYDIINNTFMNERRGVALSQLVDSFLYVLLLHYQVFQGHVTKWFRHAMTREKKMYFKDTGERHDSMQRY